jgi:NAD-dependent deacetylase sirtuin 4
MKVILTVMMIAATTTAFTSHHSRLCLKSSSSPLRRILISSSSRTTSASSLVLVRPLVTLHGTTHTVRSATTSGERPPDPNSLLTPAQLEEKANLLVDWLQDKQQVLCLTGAGLSTESGIPDYRGHGGSYHTGHKPMLHAQFMSSSYQRQRYWGRGMVGWRFFHEREPNQGHFALAELERLGKLGLWVQSVRNQDDEEEENYYMNGRTRVSIITQNVDRLHARAGSEHLIELHGRTDQLVCMNCNSTHDRGVFHSELEALNADWLREQEEESAPLRPDGDANLKTDTFEAVQVPPCPQCGDGFLKPDVVFFGDSVPKHRVELCSAAVEACDGLLVVGSSLAVHSAFRHVRAASQMGKPICILNVGTTRAEDEGLEHVLKIEAPSGPTLAVVVEQFVQRRQESSRLDVI